MSCRSLKLRKEVTSTSTSSLLFAARTPAAASTVHCTRARKEEWQCSACRLPVYWAEAYLALHAASVLAVEGGV